MINRAKLFGAMVASALALSFSSAEAQLRPGDPGYFTWLYSHTRAAVLDTVLQVREFSVARAADDQAGMEINAAELLGALTQAREWTAGLDRTVTASGFTPEIDAAVADLAELTSAAHDTLVDDLVGDDMAAIGRQLDESADVFNRMSRDLSTLNVMLREYI